MHEWDLTPKQAIALQKELARRVPRVVEIIDGKITRDEFVGGAAWTGY